MPLLFRLSILRGGSACLLAMPISDVPPGSTVIGYPCGALLKAQRAEDLSGATKRALQFTPTAGRGEQAGEVGAR
jgi:hypothetical protein